MAQMSSSAGAPPPGSPGASGARLGRADDATFCVEAGKQSWLYHLQSSAQEDNSMNWGAVKGSRG